MSSYVVVEIDPDRHDINMTVHGPYRSYKQAQAKEQELVRKGAGCPASWSPAWSSTSRS